MRALAAAVALYVVGVLVYFAWAGVVKYQAGGVAEQAAQLSGEYTNVLRLKARGDILQEQLNLRFASLDAWRLVSEHLPEGLKLTSMSFGRGKSVQLFGDAPADEFSQLAAFNTALARASLTPGGPPFFVNVTPPNSQTSPSGLKWSFSLELAGAEIP
jgi:hypothetical protein